MIVVVGASGTLGRRIVLRLLDEGVPVRALSRDPGAKLASLAQRGAGTAPADLRDPASLSRVLDGAEAVVSSAQAAFPPVRGNDVNRVDHQGTRRLIDAASKSGVGHFVLVSNGISRKTRFGRAKQRAEDHLSASGLAFTIVRPTTFIETHALLLMAQPMVEGKPVRLMGPGRTPLNWVSADDVADDVVGILRDDPVRGVRTVGGPDRMTRVEAVEAVERVLDRKAKTTHLPLPMLRGMRTFFRPFHSSLSDLLEISLLEADRPEDPGWAPPRLDWTAPTSLEEVVADWKNGAKA